MHRSPSTRPSAPGSATLTKVLVLALLSMAFVLAPAPRVSAAEGMEVETRTPTLQAAGVPTGTVMAASVAGEDLRAELERDGRRLAAEQVEPFDLLGVTVPGSTPPQEHVLARARVAGVWTPWIPVELNDGHRPEGRERAIGARTEPGLHSDPVWFGGADAYEVSVPAGVSTVEVHLVRPTVETITMTASEATAGAAPAAPTAPSALSAPGILSRAQWGARPPAVTPTVAADLKIAVVHHSVHANTYSREDVPALLRSIQQFHMDVQGWNDIAYNFAVDRFGRIWEARAGGVTQDVIGGHAQGFNTYSTGVMVLGDFTSAEPTQAAVNAVADVIGWKFARHQVDVRGSTQFTSLGGARYASGTQLQLPRIVGHGDVGRTGCPGSRLAARLGEIRTRAVARMEAYLLDQPAQPLFGDFDGDGLRDVLRYRAGAGADVLWSHPGTGTLATPLTVAGIFRPVVADLDGDHRDDILWYSPGSAPADRVWSGGPAGFTSRAVDLPEQGIPHVAELDGDGIDDVVVYAPGGSPDRIYSGRSNRTLVALPLGVDGTYDVTVGDFDGDARDDLFWYDHGSGADSITYSEGSGEFATLPLAVGGSAVTAVGDFDGNGRDDLLLYGRGDAPDEIRWSELLGRGSFTTEAIRVRGTGYWPQRGDVDGDGADELLWYAPGPSADPLWDWNLLRLRSERVLSVGGAFVPDLGRYTPDGLDDIAWVSPSSASYLWTATGGGAFRSAPIG
jgi:hypothetical protein